MLTGLVRQSISPPRGNGRVRARTGGLWRRRRREPRLDVFPEFAPPQVSIQTEAPGLSPEQVEILVTKPIEDAINGVEGIATVRSQSIQGLSVITAVLADRRGHLPRPPGRWPSGSARPPGGCPATVEPPVLTPLTSSSSTVLVVGVTSETPLAHGAAHLRRLDRCGRACSRRRASPRSRCSAARSGSSRSSSIPDAAAAATGSASPRCSQPPRQATGVRGAGVHRRRPTSASPCGPRGRPSRPATLARTVVRERDGLGAPARRSRRASSRRRSRSSARAA